MASPNADMKGNRSNHTGSIHFKQNHWPLKEIKNNTSLYSHILKAESHWDWPSGILFHFLHHMRWSSLSTWLDSGLLGGHKSSHESKEYFQRSLTEEKKIYHAWTQQHYIVWDPRMIRKQKVGWLPTLSPLFPDLDTRDQSPHTPTVMVFPSQWTVSLKT